MNRRIYILIGMFVMYQGSVSAMAELPDPTQPADYLAVPKTIEVNELPKELIDWNVTAIRINEKTDDRSAIINGQIARPGDQIGPATVLEINPVSVVLNYENKHVVVRLFSNIVQKKITTSSNINKN